MILGFDAKRAFHNATGLGNYSRDLLRILRRHAPEHRCLAYSPRPPRAASSSGTDGLEVRGPRSALGRAFPALWRARGIVEDLAADSVELYHGLSNELPLGLEGRGIASAVTIHDLIFERFPELYAPVDRRIYRWKAQSAVRRADLILAVSEQTRRDLVELYGVPSERIRVVYQGCHPAFQEALPAQELAQVRERLRLPEGFVLSVGTIERRKNLLTVLRALAELPKVPLVVVGRRTSYAREVESFVRQRGLEDRVQFLSGVSLRELAALYRLAAVFVYPSLFEGFGIPILEALFSGAPVVTTRGGVFPEAGGPGSAYVDPANPEELREALAAILGDESRREHMREAGREHAARFRDEVIAQELLAAYGCALARARSGPSGSRAPIQSA